MYCIENTRECKAVLELQPGPKYRTCRGFGGLLQPVVPRRGRRGRLAAENGQDAGGLCRACSDCRSQRTTESRAVIVTATFEKSVEAPTLDGLTSLYICENNRGSIFPVNVVLCKKNKIILQLPPLTDFTRLGLNLYFHHGCSQIIRIDRKGAASGWLARWPPSGSPFLPF